MSGINSKPTAMQKLLFIILLVITCLPVFSQATAEECVKYLKENPISPAEYVVSKFDQYDLVIAAEDHAIRQNLEFVNSLIPKLYNKGVYNLAMEFGASEMQTEMDSLLVAKTFNADLAKHMMYFYNVGWAYKEYYSICETVWKFNRNLPRSAPKFRIVNLSYQYDWSALKQGEQRTSENMPKIFTKGTPDKFRASIVEKEIMSKKQKAFLLVGLPHAYTKYSLCYDDFLKDNFVRCDSDWLGQRLLQQYPGKITSIMFHQTFGNLPYAKPYRVSPGDGMIEKVMALNSNKPLGFDLNNSALGKITDHSRHSVGYKNFTLGLLFDGYLFLVPFSKMEGCTFDSTFFDNEKWDEISAQIPDRDWRGPISNLNDFILQIKAYADLKKRYDEVLK
jgi:hypothetical protein